MHNRDAIILRLLTTEAMAQEVITECQATRRLLEEGEVSTPPTSQVTKAKIASMLAKRKKSILKRANQFIHGNA